MDQKDIAWMNHFLIGIFLLFTTPLVAIDEFTMDSNCGQTISVTSGAVLRLTSSARYASKLKCSVQFFANPGWVFMVKFQMLDIESSSHCQTDSLRVFDGYQSTGTVTTLTGDMGLCGEDAPSQTYLTSTNKVSFLFTSDESIEEDGFTVILTSFHNGACTNTTGEFRCDNGRCISRSITCDTYNHCGDWSDEEVDCLFGLGKGAIIGIVLGATVLFIIIVGCVIAITCNNKTSGGRQHRTALGSVDFWASKSDRDDGFTNPGYGIDNERY